MPILRLLALALLLACSDSATAPRVPPVLGGARVLFIGNSLTYVNDVPGLVVAIARQMGDTSIGTASVAFPDYALEDHWNEGTAARALTDQRWEFVVMQQGPSSLPASRVHLEEWTRRFAPLVRAAGAKPVLYQVWPHVSRRGDAPNAFLSYQNAATAINGKLAPAGAAWDSVLASQEPAPLYSSDGLHASPLGSWLAAVVIYATLREIDPVTLPPTLPPSLSVAPLSQERVRQLLRHASAAMTVAASKGSTARRASAPPRLRP